MYKCIIFDVDGTLIDTEKGILLSLQRVLKDELNRDFDLKELRFALGITGETALNELGIKNIKKACESWTEYAKDYSDMTRIYEGIEQTLLKLNEKGIYTGITTSRTIREIENDECLLGLEKFMNTVISADDTKNHKPDPEPLLKFLQESKMDPSSALYIGDTIYDMKCAMGAGIDFALALWGAKSLNGITCAKYFLNSPDEILGLV